VGTGGSGAQVVPSTWVVLSPDNALIDELGGLDRWRALDTDRTVPWTDDFSSLVTVLR